jgi:group I intron endonuclease
MKAGIYQIRCLANDKVYIGSAVDLGQRWRTHRHRLRSGVHHSVRLQNAWRKYGEEQFVFEILEFVSNADDLVRIEQGWLDRLRPTGRQGYNVRTQAKSNLGVKASEETRARMSAALMGHSSCGHTAETRAKISASRKGLKASPETRAKMSAMRKGRKFGKEARANMSMSAIKRKLQGPKRKAAKNQAAFRFTD